MSDNTAKKEEGRISRLDIVRSGAAETTSLKMPRRGRQLVDIESIIPDPRNERKAFLGIEGLSASIKQIGLVESPTVVPLEDGRFMLTTGERRWRAAKNAGLRQIHVIIGDPEEDRVRRVKSLISNVQREDLSALELAQALHDMKADNPDIKTNRDLAALVGKSEQWVGQILKLTGLSESVQNQIRGAERVIPYESIIQISRVESEIAQAELLKGVLAGASVREVREQAKSSKPTHKKTDKRTTNSTQKVSVSKGWVVIHCTDGSATAKKTTLAP